MCYITTSCFAGLLLTLQNENFHLFATYESSVWVALWCQRIIFTSSVMFILSISNPEIFSISQTLLVNIAFCLLGFSELYIDIFDSLLLNIAALSYYGIFHFFSLLLCLWWGSKLWRSSTSWNTSNNTSAFYLAVFIFYIISALISLLIVTFHFFHTLYFKSSLLLPIYVSGMMNIIISIIPGRIVRLEALNSKDHIIATKQADV